MGKRATEIAPARSETRRAAKALVARRVETFATQHPLDASRARLEREFAALGKPRAVDFAGTWKTVDGHDVYEAGFAPPRSTQRILSAGSIALAALIAASAWLLYTGDAGAPMKFLLPLFTVLSVFALPLVVAMLASLREAEESRIRRAINRALTDSDLRYPPQQQWKDED